MIPDASAAPVRIVSTSTDAPDLTYSDLRSVSPVHHVYLGNMGVVASLSFPLLKRGQLVGLIAAHHREVRNLPFEVLEQCTSLVARHADTAVTYELQQTLRRQDSITQRIQQLRSYVGSLDDHSAQLGSARRASDEHVSRGRRPALQPPAAARSGLVRRRERPRAARRVVRSQ